MIPIIWEAEVLRLLADLFGLYPIFLAVSRIAPLVDASMTELLWKARDTVLLDTRHCSATSMMVGLDMKVGGLKWLFSFSESGTATENSDARLKRSHDDEGILVKKWEQYHKKI
jgi:hypothetical protein